MGLYGTSGLGIPDDYYTALSRGRILTSTIFSIIGQNLDIDTASVPEDIWPVGGEYPFQTAAVTLEMLSTSVNDTLLGTGARTILVSGLNLAFVPVSETVNLNGVGVVALVNSYYRINDVRVATAGSSSINLGDITLRLTGAGVTQAFIPIGFGRSQACIYTVPAAKRAWLVDSTFQLIRATANDVADIHIRTRSPNSPWIVLVDIGLAANGESIVQRQPRITFGVDAGTDISVRAVDVNANNIAVSGSITGELQNV